MFRVLALRLVDTLLGDDPGGSDLLLVLFMTFTGISELPRSMGVDSLLPAEAAVEAVADDEETDTGLCWNKSFKLVPSPENWPPLKRMSRLSDFDTDDDKDKLLLLLDDTSKNGLADGAGRTSLSNIPSRRALVFGRLPVCREP